VLVRLIEDLYRRKFRKPSRKHPATRIFQALRIAVNKEFENIEKVLPQAIDLLTVGGRLAVISFHSGEDRIVKNFFKKMASFDDTGKAIQTADDYFKSLKEVALLEPQNFELMVIYPRKYDSREFKYYVKNIDKFMEQYPNEAELIAFNSIDLLYQEAIETQSEEKMNELSMLLTQLPNVIEDDKASQMSSMAYMSFYETTQEWDKYAPNAVQYFEKYGRDEFESFLRAAFNFYNFVEKPEDLTKMLTWLEESVVSEENYANLYLNAALLKKLDRKKEALELAKKSLAVAQLEEVNAEIIQQLITELEE
jgi:hypothetical protein